MTSQGEKPQFFLLKLWRTMSNKLDQPNKDGYRDQHLLVVIKKPASFQEWKEAGDKRLGEVQPDDWDTNGVLYGRVFGNTAELFLIHDRFGGLYHPLELKESLEDRGLKVRFFETHYARPLRDSSLPPVRNESGGERVSPATPSPDRKRSKSAQPALKQAHPVKLSKILPWPLGAQVEEKIRTMRGRRLAGEQNHTTMPPPPRLPYQTTSGELQAKPVQLADPSFSPQIQAKCARAVFTLAQRFAEEDGLWGACGIIARSHPPNHHLMLIFMNRPGYARAIDAGTCTANGVEYPIIGHFDLSVQVRPGEPDDGQGDGVWFTKDVSEGWRKMFTIKTLPRRQWRDYRVPEWVMEVNAARHALAAQFGDQPLVEEGAHYGLSIYDDLAAEEEQAQKEAERKEKTRLKKLAARVRKRAKKGADDKADAEREKT